MGGSCNDSASAIHQLEASRLCLPVKTTSIAVNYLFLLR